MSSSYGERIHLSLFGQSHGKAVGMVLDGVPAGQYVDLDQLQAFLRRRAPGGEYTSPRKEEDIPEFLSGITDSYTCGAPICAVIPNHDTRPGDYAILKDCPRPGHADLTAQLKYGGFQDAAGGGHFSGRLTAPLCVAGGLCRQWLEQMGIRIFAHIAQIGDVTDECSYLDQVEPADTDFPTVSRKAGEEMRRIIGQASRQGDSLGGIIECAVTGLPAGLGDPLFGGMESRIARIVYGIPAVKGVDFGLGFAGVALPGSRYHDGFTVADGQIRTVTNHAGGILGGITDGMPLVFRAVVKPTPSISLPQTSVSLSAMEERELTVPGRHDPCIVPRAVPAVEAAAAIAVYDAYLLRESEIAHGSSGIEK